MRIIYDLDGVLRDLNQYLNTKYGVPYPNKWIWTYEGKNIFEWIEDDSYLALLYSPITEYFTTIRKNVKQIELWTCQPVKWRQYTELWISNNLVEHYTINYLTTQEKEKRLYNNKGIYLVEDSPNFTNYKNILLIDRPYNQEVKCENRIFTPEQLLIWIEREKGDHNV